jgi:hypothetical protein
MDLKKEDVGALVEVKASVIQKLSRVDVNNDLSMKIV